MQTNPGEPSTPVVVLAEAVGTCPKQTPEQRLQEQAQMFAKLYAIECKLSDISCLGTEAALTYLAIRERQDRVGTRAELPNDFSELRDLVHKLCNRAAPAIIARDLLRVG